MWEFFPLGCIVHASAVYDRVKTSDKQTETDRNRQKRIETGRRTDKAIVGEVSDSTVLQCSTVMQ